MILLIDDDEIQNFVSEKMIRNVLPEVALEVRSNGQQGLDALYEEGLEPELILLDINMPIKTGWDFVDEYMKHDHPKMPIYILTSSINERDRERADSYACIQGFLVKPLNLDVLKELISKHQIV